MTRQLISTNLNQSQPTGNHCSVHLTRSVRRAAGFSRGVFGTAETRPQASESVEKLDLEKISFGLTSPCCATGYSREEQRR
jgi:hypothetical protein